MQKTSIEYLTHSWNPIKMLCTPVSSGCANCWAIRRAKMLANNPSIYADHQRAYKGGPPILDYKELEAPLHLRKPARIGCQFMGDLLHGSIDGFWISAMWGVMQRCPQHKFFLLTKRPERFLSLTPPLPVLENVWFGVSISGPVDLWMIEILLQIQAAHRWISIEPMLGPIKLPKKALCPCSCYAGKPKNPHPDCAGQPTIDWVVLGGETGPKARPCQEDWVISIKNQCVEAGIPFFFKHWGSWNLSHNQNRLVDGREWNEMP